MRIFSTASPSVWAVCFLELSLLFQYLFAHVITALSLIDLEVALSASNFVAGYASLGLRVTLCVGSSRLGMLDYKTSPPPP